MGGCKADPCICIQHPPLSPDIFINLHVGILFIWTLPSLKPGPPSVATSGRKEGGGNVSQQHYCGHFRCDTHIEHRSDFRPCFIFFFFKHWRHQSTFVLFFFFFRNLRLKRRKLPIITRRTSADYTVVSVRNAEVRTNAAAVSFGLITSAAIQREITYYQL